MRIAIVAHNAYGSISETPGGHVGGVERQMAMLARWLAKQDHDVSLITWREGAPKDELIGGVRVLKTCSRDDGLPVLRFFAPRWTSLIQALRRADAELYLHNGAEYVTGQVAMWCRLQQRRFLFLSASDYDCDRDVSSCGSLREKVLYRYGLRNADRIIVQTDSQAADMKQYHHLASVVLPMPCEAWQETAISSAAVSNALPLVLLVGRIAPEKNVAMFIELAKRLPTLQFKIVGPTPPNDAYVNGVVRLAREVANVSLYGVADRQQLGELYSSALVLCNTSHFEGFPNTFIEAWSLGLPVISRIDPGGVIELHGLGAHAAKLEDMQRRLVEIADSPQLRAEIGKRARTYFEENHELSKAMSRFERVFQEL